MRHVIAFSLIAAFICTLVYLGTNCVICTPRAQRPATFGTVMREAYETCQSLEGEAFAHCVGDVLAVQRSIKPAKGRDI